MYIEQLTEEQVNEFATMLKVEAQKATNSEWKTIISKPFNARVIIAIYCTNPTWDICVHIYDFHIEVIKSILVEHSVIKEQYARFMYEIFGEEYKKKYIAARESMFEKY